MIFLANLADDVMAYAISGGVLAFVASHIALLRRVDSIATAIEKLVNLGERVFKAEERLDSHGQILDHMRHGSRDTSSSGNP